MSNFAISDEADREPHMRLLDTLDLGVLSHVVQATKAWGGSNAFFVHTRGWGSNYARDVQSYIERLRLDNTQLPCRIKLGDYGWQKASPSLSIQLGVIKDYRRFGDNDRALLEIEFHSLLFATDPVDDDEDNPTVQEFLDWLAVNSVGFRFEVQAPPTYYGTEQPRAEGDAFNIPIPTNYAPPMEDIDQ